MESYHIYEHGDAQGHIAKSERLHHTMGAIKSQDDGRRLDRTAASVDDLIGRGHTITRVSLVRSMADTGATRVVMRNHEFNINA